MKIIRLAYFNIKKHKAESISIVILLSICMMLLCSSISSFTNISHIFGRVMDELHGIKNSFIIQENNYYPIYDSIISANDRITKFEHIDCIASYSTSYLDVNDKESSQFMFFVNEENEKKIEDFNLVTNLSKEDIQKIEHPIYAPFYVQDTLKKNIGDTFTIIFNGKQYPFTIAGFAESCIFSDNMFFLKFIVSDDDFRLLQKVIGKAHMLGFEVENNNSEYVSQIVSSFKNYVDENTNNGEILGIQDMTFKDLEFSSGGYIKIILLIMLSMALVVLFAVLIMIGHQISNDINEQVVSIGVLEALGYKSKEISFSYVFEYIILGLMGTILGIFFSLFLNPFIYQIGQMMTGHHTEMKIIVWSFFAISFMLMLFVISIALLKAKKVKKYPPVIALRKGIGDHHFGINILPLEKTKTNIHIRLAAKGAIANTKKSIGIAICVAIASAAILGCYAIYAYCSTGVNAIRTLCGLEIADLRVSLSKNCDYKLMKEELLTLPEVDKINETNDWLMTRIQFKDKFLFPIIYEDYENTSEIRTCTGRLPKHANEITMTNVMSKQFNINIGDTVAMKFGRIEKNFLVTGFVSSITNLAHNVYFTSDGFKRLKASYHPDVLEITLKDGVEKKEFKNWIAHTYGKSLADSLEDNCQRATKEERIKAEAEKKMALLLSTYGLSHAEYSVIIDGQTISGNSSIFKVTSILSLGDTLVSQLSNAIKAFSVGTRLFMIVAIVVVMIIMFMLMESSVKKQRAELGIYKGMGYTSNELMLQLSFRTVPVLIVGIIIGTLMATFLFSFMSSIIGSLSINWGGIIIIDIFILIFAFAAAYFGARKIKTISVYELMTE